MNRLLSLALVLSAPTAFPALSHAADLKIGYVDLQRALEETEEGKSAKKKLKADFEKKQKDLDVRQEELKKMKEDIDKQKSVLKPEAVAAKEGELNQKVVKLQETYMRLQKELQEKEAAETGRIFKRMKQVIQGIAEQEHVTFVLEANSGILYAPPSLDLTNELIRKYNASGTAGTGGK